MIAVVKDKKADHFYVVIDNYDSLMYYRDMFLDKSTKLFKDFIEEWFSENNKEPLYRRISHTVSNFDNAKIMTLCEIYAGNKSKTGNINIVDLAHANDALMDGKLNTMMRFINRETIVRVNKDGGICPISADELEKEYDIIVHYEGEYNPTQENHELETIKNFIYKKSLEKPNLNINTSVLVIENSNLKPNLISDYTKYLKQTFKMNENDISFFNHFIITEKMFQPEVFLESFQDGLKNGLNTLVFKTMGYYRHQFEMLYELLYNSKHLLPKNFRIITNYEKIKKMFEGNKELKIKVTIDKLEYFRFR